MYGTCARMVLKPENREKMQAIFEDRATYDANADDPKQHEMYVKYRALLEEEPEWHDGEIRSFP